MPFVNMLTHKPKITYLYATPDASVEEFYRLKQVRPIAGKQYAEGLEEDDINTENYFNLIEGFKSDFAYQLMIELEENNTGFTVPNYIKSGILFLNESQNDNE
jgi:hypothetical protein